jgi:hypothetical protein
MASAGVQAKGNTADCSQPRPVAIACLGQASVHIIPLSA